MNKHLKLVVNNSNSNQNQKYFFEKDELKVILDLYAKMVSNGSWKDYGLKISSKQVAFSVFKNSSENAVYNICKNFRPIDKNLTYLITDTNGKILKKLLGNAINLSEEGWKILNNRWMYFFFSLALLNELVWRTQSEEFWVNFKVWGLLPITFIFTAFQIKLINKYKTNE